jgi:hypothetical protein
MEDTKQSADHSTVVLVNADIAPTVSRPSVKRKAETKNAAQLRSGCDSDQKSAYQRAYDGVTFTPVAVSTGRPGTPHCFFKSSFQVTLPDTIIDTADESTATPRTAISKMRVHQHANGLCVVCLDDEIDSITEMNGNEDCRVEFTVSEIPDLSLAQKRKRGAKQLRGKKHSTAESDLDVGSVLPTTTLCEIVKTTKSTTDTMPTAATPTTRSTIAIPCCVFGSVLELNHGITPSLLQSDPLLKGYLAIVLPAGTFPPAPLPPSPELDK